MVQFDFSWPQDGTGRVRFSVTCETAPDPALEERLNGILSLWCRVGALGGFPARGSTPSESDLTVTSVAVEGTLWISKINAENVDPAATVLLANMLRKLGPSIAAARIDPVEQARSVVVATRIPRFEDSAEFFPSGTNTLSFVLEDDADQVDTFRHRRALLIGYEAFTLQQYEALSEISEAWTGILGAGAYAAPLKSCVSAWVLPEAFEFYTDRILELTLSIFEASEQSWLCLACMIERFNRPHGAIRGILVS